jgi:hypothetical protein
MDWNLGQGWVAQMDWNLGSHGIVKRWHAGVVQHQHVGRVLLPYRIYQRKICSEGFDVGKFIWTTKHGLKPPIGISIMSFLQEDCIEKMVQRENGDEEGFIMKANAKHAKQEPYKTMYPILNCLVIKHIGIKYPSVLVSLEINIQHKLVVEFLLILALALVSAELIVPTHVLTLNHVKGWKCHPVEAIGEYRHVSRVAGL